MLRYIELGPSAICPAELYARQRGLFDEDEHPRAADGEFAKKEDSGAGSPADTKETSGIDKSDSPSALAKKEENKSETGIANTATTLHNAEQGNGANATSERAKTMQITRNSSTRNVDAYRVGALYKHDGAWHVITGYHRSADDHGGYEHRLGLRPATADEAKQGRVQDIERELSAMAGGPDDDQMREAHQRRYRELQNERNSLTGRKSVDEEQADKKNSAERQRADVERMKTATREEKDAHYRKHAAPIALVLKKHISGDDSGAVIAGLMEAVRNDWDGNSDPAAVSQWVMSHARDGNADGDLRFDKAAHPATEAYLASRRPDPVPEEDPEPEMVVVAGNTYPHKDTIKRIPGAQFRGGKWSIPREHAGRLPRGLSAK